MLEKKRDDELRYDLYDKFGKRISKTTYRYISYFYDNIAIIQSDDNRKYGGIDLNGDEAIPFIYDGLDNFNCGRAKFTKNEKSGIEWRTKHGFVDIYGAEYHIDADRFCEELAKFCIQDRYGFKNLKGEIIIPPIYDEASEFKNGLSFVTVEDKMVVIDKNGSTVIGNNWDKIEEIHDDRNILLIIIDDKFGLINLQGDILIPPIFNNIYPLSKYGKSYMVSSYNKYGIYKIGCTLEPQLIYDNILGYSYVDNMMPVCIGKMWGMIYGNGEEFIPCVYSRIHMHYPNEKNDRMKMKYFVNNLLLVFKEHTYSFVN